jgi:hypothetical protein
MQPNWPVNCIVINLQLLASPHKLKRIKKIGFVKSSQRVCKDFRQSKVLSHTRYVQKVPGKVLVLRHERTPTDADSSQRVLTWLYTCSHSLPHVLASLSHAIPDKERECLCRRRVQNDGENGTSVHLVSSKSRENLHKNIWCDTNGFRRGFHEPYWSFWTVSPF